MANIRFKSVDDYVASHPERVQAILEQVRGVLRRALPGAEEAISYQIPAYKVGGRAVIYFAGWKAHYSVYPATAAVLSELADDLAPYETSKGTVRFPLDRPVPRRLIARIAKIRAREEAERPTRNRRAHG